MLDNLAVVLFQPKFSENIGATARACANMGCGTIIVVRPREWDIAKAEPLATPKGAPLLKTIRFEDDLASALAPFSAVFGTTARQGGWRKAILTPSQAAPRIVESMGEPGGAAVVFGPEDKGLTNEQIDICGQLLTIPTASDASSLNLAQAVLIILYECFKNAPNIHFRPAGPPHSRPATHQELETLYATLRETLTAIDYFRDDNLDYWMLPIRRFLNRVNLRRNEFNQIMGVCRQLDWAHRNRKKDED